MKITLDPKMPIYLSIKRSIQERIECGDLAPGDRVWSELQLAKELNVSRSQTRQALRDLEMEGLLERTPRGSFVAPVHIQKSGQARQLEKTVTFAYPSSVRRYVRSLTHT